MPTSKTPMPTPTPVQAGAVRTLTVRMLAARATLALGLCVALAAVTTSPPAQGKPPSKAAKHARGHAKPPIKKAPMKKTALKKPVAPPTVVKPVAPPTVVPPKEVTPVVPPVEDTAALVAQGKALAMAKNCTGCHQADLGGKQGGPPSLRVSGIQSQYTAQSWAKMLDTGETPDGGKVHPPMPVFHLSAEDSAALWAYVKTLP